jgi:GTP-binding protein
LKELKAEFLRGFVKLSECPDFNLPEIAFTGRSNVGKSSLLNNLVLMKNLARTSRTPGKTREINLFKIENKWIFADLPGMGYAAVSKSFRELWSKLMMEYFEQRKQLSMVCNLIDSRHDPMDKDLALIEYLENIGKKYLIILTKCDKISKVLVEERVSQLHEVTKLCSFAIDVVPHSSVTMLGRSEILGIIAKHASLKR